MEHFRPTTEVGRLQTGEGLSHVEQATVSRAIDQAERPDDRESLGAGCRDACPVVHQDQVGLEGEGNENGFPLTSTKTLQGRIAVACVGLDRKPGGHRRHPRPHGSGRTWLGQFAANGLGDENCAEQRRQDMRLLDEDQVVEGAGVGDDDAQSGSEAKPGKVVPVLVEVVDVIVQEDATRLEESVESHPAVEAEKLTQFGIGQPVGPIFLDGKGFEGPPREVATLGAQAQGKAIRNRHSDVHTIHITPRPPIWQTSYTQ